MSRYCVNSILRRIQKFVTSIYFVPILFFLLNWPLWLGITTFGHDTGDGIAAFKFWTFFPRYWNWFESAGQPFWHDLSIFKLNDPLLWPVLTILKALPIHTLSAFNIFILFRIAFLGVGIECLARAMGFQRKTSQLMAFIGLFTSLGTGVYEQIGIHDITFSFLFFFWAILRLAQTQNTKYLLAIGLLSLHCATSYHVLYLIPLSIPIAFYIFFFKNIETKPLLLVIKHQAIGILTIGLATLCAFFSVRIATTSPDSIPVLRNMTYTSFVNDAGVNLTDGYYKGQNLFDKSRIRVNSSDCNRITHCSFYNWKYLKSLVTGKPPFPGILSAEFTAYIGRIAFIISLIGFFSASPIKLILVINLFFSFFLSLGTATPIWPFFQKTLPLLSFARHTHFYMAIFLLSLIGLFGLGMELLAKKVGHRRKTLLPIIIALLISETFFFFFNRGFALQETVLPGQNELISKPLPNWLVSRQFRLMYPSQVPRSGAGTAFSIPTAIEALEYNFPRPPKHSEIDFIDIRLVGYVTPFILKHTFTSRLLLSLNSNAFKRVFGISPFTIFSLYSWEKAFIDSNDQVSTLNAIAEGKILIPRELQKLAPKRSSTSSSEVSPVPIFIQGDELVTEVTISEPQLAFFSLPAPHISQVLINGQRTSFFQANIFGLAVPLAPGKHKITIIPHRSHAIAVTTFYYLAYIIIFSYFIFTLIRDRKKNECYVWICVKRDLLSVK